MPAEHLIRLRGAWTRHDVGVGDEPGRRVDLPTAGTPEFQAPVHLVRPFGRPPIDPGRERLALRLEAIVGLRAVRLNGRVLARPPAGTEALELPLDEPLPRRNLLELEIEPARRPDRASGDDLWGCVALVVSPRPPTRADEELGRGRSRPL